MMESINLKIFKLHIPKYFQFLYHVIQGSTIFVWHFKQDDCVQIKSY
jgi:hypothetical protein